MVLGEKKIAMQNSTGTRVRVLGAYIQYKNTRGVYYTIILVVYYSRRALVSLCILSARSWAVRAVPAIPLAVFRKERIRKMASAEGNRDQIWTRT